MTDSYDNDFIEIALTVPREPILRMKEHRKVCVNECNCDGVQVEGHAIISIGPSEIPSDDTIDDATDVAYLSPYAATASHSHVPLNKPRGIFYRLFETHRPRVTRFIILSLSAAFGSFLYWLLNLAGRSDLEQVFLICPSKNISI